MITNLQLLRGLAALGVVVYHTNLHVNGVHSELMGVAIFFVISGFIMVHITRETDEGFLIKRLIRIVPLYWILTVAAFLWFGLGFANPPYTWPLWASFIAHHPISLLRWFAAQAYAITTPESAMALLRSLTFWPTAQDPMPILPVGWTLNIEMFFYLLFAFALLAGRTAAPLLSGAVLTALFFLNKNGILQSKVLATFGHNYVIYFVFGMITYFLWRKLEPIIKTFRKTAVTASACVLVCWPIICFTPLPFPEIQFLLLPPLVVLSLLVLHSANIRLSSRLLIDFGGASYALYLVHVPVLETLRATSAAFPLLQLATPIGAMIAASVSGLLAMLIYYKLEMPLLRYLHSRLRSPAPIAAPVPSGA
jgi:exopolysaccharide production protein ExoZ